MTLRSAAGEASLPEEELRDSDTTLRLALHGPASWSAAARAGDLSGFRLSLQPAVNLNLLRVLAPSDGELLLTLERHRTFDVPADTPLTLHVTHRCAGSALVTSAMPCYDGDGAAPAASELSASITVRSGGAPPGKPGAPYLQHMNSYGSLRIVWAPPDDPGDSPVSGYAWVEYVGGVPVLTGDAVPAAWATAANASLVSEMGGYRRGYGVLPGALAAVNRGGYSEFSAAWPTATMGTPGAPLAVVATVAAAELRVEWRPPAWDGGFPLDHYALSLRRWSAAGQRWERLSDAALAADVLVAAPAALADAARGAGAAEVAALMGATQSHALGPLRPAEYRVELRAFNSQGDASARALSNAARVPGGWCGWQAADGGLTCNDSMVVIVAAALVAAAICCAAWRWRGGARRPRGGAPWLWRARAHVYDGEEAGEAYAEPSTSTHEAYAAVRRQSSGASGGASLSEGSGRGSARADEGVRGRSALAWLTGGRAYGACADEGRDVEAMRRRRGERGRRGAPFRAARHPPVRRPRTARRGAAACHAACVPPVGRTGRPRAHPGPGRGGASASRASTAATGAAPFPNRAGSTSCAACSRRSGGSGGSSRAPWPTSRRSSPPRAPTRPTAPASCALASRRAPTGRRAPSARRRATRRRARSARRPPPPPTASRGCRARRARTRAPTTTRRRRCRAPRP